MTKFRGSRWAAAVLTIVSLSATVGWTSAAPASQPFVDFATPASWQNFAAGQQIAASGPASDRSAVSQVALYLRNTGSGLYLTQAGTWTQTAVSLPTHLGQEHSQTTTWSDLLPGLPVGSYTIQAFAVNRAGLRTAPMPVVEVVVPPTDPIGAGFVGMNFARAQWVSTENCKPLPHAITLSQVALALHQRGLAATTTVVTSFTGQSTRQCELNALTASWDDLASLRDSYAWTVMSAGIDRVDLTKLTVAQQYAESCGSLPTFWSEGDARAWGLFGYANDHSDLQLQQQVVSSCFAFGRTYALGVNQRASTVSPWFQVTEPVAGGPCNDPSLACYAMSPTASSRYTSPQAIAAAAKVAGDEWTQIQLYRFVTGSRRTGKFQWDCTSTDWRRHWVNASAFGEIYCWNDFLAALALMPATAPTGQAFGLVDPATVAEAWGRSPVAGLPPALSYGPVSVGTTATLPVTISDPGPLPLHIFTATVAGPNASDFVVMTDACGGTDVPPSGSCSMMLSFSPAAAGNRSAALVVASTDPTTPTSVVLGGAGV